MLSIPIYIHIIIYNSFYLKEAPLYITLLTLDLAVEFIFEASHFEFHP